ncbi:hypothetical protein AVEN_221050-1 [Araneus ventricosus]|uniref:Uncharacterized protein n=1 Tax=Araneus ventricosus TaxID=182803 RepID=A0A4Y2Q2T0_ARAVE|nr:hypothetical protein AVEN_221050-1 [Araneus ventricosus]
MVFEHRPIITANLCLPGCCQSVDASRLEKRILWSQDETIENILHVIARSGHVGVGVWRDLAVLVQARQIRRRQRHRQNRNFQAIVKELVSNKRLIKVHDRCYPLLEPEDDPYLRDLLPLSAEDRGRILEFLEMSRTGRCYRDLQREFTQYSPPVLKNLMIRLIRDGFVEQDYEARFYKVIED